MKIFAAALLLVCACSGSSPPTAPPSNQPTAVADQAPSTTAPEVTISIVAADGLTAGTGSLAGSIAAVGELLHGATVVASSPALEGSQSAITDEHGRFTLVDLPAGSYSVDVYYEDATFQHRVELVAGKRTELRVANWRFERSEVIVIE